VSPRQPRVTPPECLYDPLLGRHLYVKINGIKYHYVENGSRRQTLVLLLHDFGDFWFGWRNQLTGLSGSSWVVALDLKGFGDSDKPFMSHHYKDGVMVEEIKAFVDVIQQSERKIIIIGHGLGGHLAWMFAEKYPESVSKFISIATPHPRVWLRHVLQSWRSIIENRWLFVCRLPFLPEMELISHDLEIFDKRFASVSDVIDLKHVSVVDLEAYKYSFSRTGDWQGPVNYLRNLPLADTSVLTLDRDGADSVIPVEGLIVAGNLDPEVSLDLVTQSAEYLERFAMHIVNCSGHFPHQEQPDLVNKHILKFLKVPDLVKESSPVRDTFDMIKKHKTIQYQVSDSRHHQRETYTAPIRKSQDSSVMAAVSSISFIASSLPIIGSYVSALGWIL